MSQNLNQQERIAFTTDVIQLATSIMRSLNNKPLTHQSNSVVVSALIFCAAGIVNEDAGGLLGPGDLFRMSSSGLNAIVERHGALVKEQAERN